jgi:hypothetical protein
MAPKRALDTGAAMLGRRIPGRGKSTFTKFFVSGILCPHSIQLPDTQDTVRGEPVHCDADGKRGSGKRVWRWFPMIDKWEASVSFQVIADEIPEALFEETLKQAGMFVGIGRFRPENGGIYGRWVVDKVDWQEL